MTNEYINSRQEAKVFSAMARIEQGQEIRDTLIAYALKKGVSEQDSEMLADRIMSGVYAYEDTREKLESSAAGALEPLFQKLSGMPLKDQAAVLDQILFALEAMGDDKLYEKAASKNAYPRARRNAVAGTAGEVETLKAKLLHRIENMELSSKALDAIVSNLEKSGDYTAAAAALGRKGYALKCVTAMMLHLDSAEGADVSRSIAAACTGVDIQALGDAVDRGLMARKIARVILNVVICAALILIAVFFTSFFYEYAIDVMDLMMYLGGMVGLAAIFKGKGSFVDLSTDFVGRLTILLTGLVIKGKDHVVNGIKAIARRAAENSRTASAAETAEAPEPDWEPDEDPARAF